MGPECVQVEFKEEYGTKICREAGGSRERRQVRLACLFFCHQP